MGTLWSALLPSVSLSTVRTLIRLKAPTDAILIIREVYIGQSITETSENLEVEVRKGATSDGTGTAGTLVEWTTSGVTAGAAFVYDLSAEPAGGNIVKGDSFNVLQGWIWVPQGELIIAPGARCTLKLATAPSPAVDLNAGILFEEIG